MVYVIIIFALIATLIVIDLIVSKLIKRWHAHIIAKGKHYDDLMTTLFRLLLTTRDHLQFSVLFCEGFDYQLQGPDQQDVNKLYGFGWGWRGPSYNSTRIGWRWDDKQQKIELLLFTQYKRQMQIGSLGFIEPHQEVNLQLYAIANVIAAYLDYEGKTTLVTHEIADHVPQLKYRCFPYFGGNQPAPEQVKIFIKEGK